MNEDKAEEIHNLYAKYKEAKRHYFHLKSKPDKEHNLFGWGFLEKAKERYEYYQGQLEKL